MPFNNETVKYRYLNHVSLIAPDGSLAGQYVKVTRLPFTEYLPCEQVLISMERYSLARYLRAMYRKTFPGVRSVGEGFEHTLLYTPKAPLAAPICYELIFEKPIREFTRMGARVLVNVANDEWFRSDEEKKQHFMTGILRSVENRLPLVRATNTGLSAIVDARGVVEPSDRAPMNRQAVLRGKVILPTGGSFYTRAGYLFPGWILTPIFLALWVRASVRVRKRLRIEKAAKGKEFPDRKKRTPSKRSRA
jgi:apolipoprotein N-acyltransferase